MFNRQIAFALALTGALFYLSFFQSPQVDQDLREFNKKEKVNSSKKIKAFQQQRLGVSKQYLFQKGNQRIQWQLKSDSSQLFLLNKKHDQKKGLVEEFEKVCCLIQKKMKEEEKGKSQKLVREYRAKQMTLFYQQKEFTAKEIEAATYMLSSAPFLFL